MGIVNDEFRMMTASDASRGFDGFDALWGLVDDLHLNGLPITTGVPGAREPKNPSKLIHKPSRETSG
jgi:hypothetical protein